MSHGTNTSDPPLGLGFTPDFLLGVRRPEPDRVAPAGETRRGYWLDALCLSLLGYALFGKGWAYIGIPPVFIGEVTLLCGLAWLVWSGGWRTTLFVPCFWLVLLLGLWVAARTYPDLAANGIEAMRDAMIAGYSAFSLVTFAYVLARPARLVTLCRRFNRFTTIFVVATPFAWFGFRFFGESIPRWPWADVPLVVPKGGDIQVHLAGVLAFWVAGLGGAVPLWRLLMLAVCVVSVGTYDRAGLLSFLAIFAICFTLKPRNNSLWRLVGVGICGLVILAVSGLRVKMPNREREVSFAQVMANFTSLSGASRTGDLDETKEWRLNWWSDIVAYTLNGKYFWTGKGFGLNLADDDGYQVEDDGSLRSPHNGHLTMLARAGVPGFVLWLSCHLGWGWAMASGYLRCRRSGEEKWAALLLFLMAYGTAFTINTSFDVFIEGPMGGVWYWSVYGFGLAALWLHRHDPSALDQLPWEPASSAEAGGTQ